MPTSTAETGDYSGQRQEQDSARDRKSVLIAYATRYGHTAKIVEQIANELTRLGHATIVVRAGTEGLPAPGRLASEVNCAIVGAPLYAGRFPRALHKIIERYRNELASMPSAFFSVSPTAAYDDGEKKNAVHDIMERFLAGNDWRPDCKASFAGALLYTHYGPLIRFIMRRISQSAGGGTNIHRDYVYTDWNEIPVFAQRIDSLIRSAAREGG